MNNVTSLPLFENLEIFDVDQGHHQPLPDQGGPQPPRAPWRLPPPLPNHQERQPHDHQGDLCRHCAAQLQGK